MLIIRNEESMKKFNSNDFPKILCKKHLKKENYSLYIKEYLIKLYCIFVVI